MPPSAELAPERRAPLDRLLSVIEELPRRRDLDSALELIAAAVSDSLDYPLVALGVVVAEDQVQLRTVHGAGLVAGQHTPLTAWAAALGLDRVPPGGSSHLDGTAALWASLGFAGPGVLGEVVVTPIWGGGALLGVLLAGAPDAIAPTSATQEPSRANLLALYADQAGHLLAERARGEAGLADANTDTDTRWRLAFENNPIGTALFDATLRPTWANATLLEMLGYSLPELTSLQLADLTATADVNADDELLAELLAGTLDHCRMERRLVCADGGVIWARVHLGALRHEPGAQTAFIGQVEDISETKRAERDLAYRATHDPLTGLPNRSMLEEWLAAHLAAQRPVGVLYCDLDRFKIVNDSLGHEAGDDLLVTVTRRLRAALPDTVQLARVGGDEFVALAPGERSPERLVRLAHQLIEALQAPIGIRGHEHVVSISAGVTVSSPWHTHPDEVLREADQALLRAKRVGRARVEVYDPRIDHSATVEDLDLERSLRDATDGHGGLVPYFQPIVSLATHTAVGYEALIRWEHPTRGRLEPEEFLPLAEESGVIAELGWWMLRASCAAASQLQPATGAGRWIAVNASGTQLGRGQLPDAIRAVLSQARLNPAALHLEITETALVNASPRVIAEIREVADLGVQVALDDFGTGYSSLSLLRDLPVGTVKIDRSFVGPIARDREALAIVRSVIGLCHELSITTVAEGVETEAQLTTLHALGCSQAQGFLLGNPAPLEEVVARGDSGED